MFHKNPKDYFEENHAGVHTVIVNVAEWLYYFQVHIWSVWKQFLSQLSRPMAGLLSDQ
jgi:hypothetical protein